MKIVNLTPHSLNVFDAAGETQLLQLPSEGVARCAVVNKLIGEAAGVPLYATSYGNVEGLPEPQQDTIFVVSLLVRQAAPKRPDLASPGELIRDAEGRPVGCKGLAINQP